MSDIEPNILLNNENSDLPEAPYRGVESFRYADRAIFAARNWENKQLLNLISLYRGCLLYGQSGIGKSSIINAGLIPKLKDFNFQAEIIRIAPDKSGTFNINRIYRSDLTKKEYLPSIFEDADPTKPVISVSFKDFAAKIQSLRYSDQPVPDDNLEIQPKHIEKPIPVLIFDQFEEFITLFEEVSSSTITEKELSISKRKEFQKEIITFLKDSYYDSDIRVKILFVFREDYLAKLSKLFLAIPDLRDHTLRLKAIPKEDILEIIQCPFNTEKGERKYNFKPFKDTIPLIAEKLKQYFNEENAILTDIQIACLYLYETSVEERNKLLNLPPEKNCIEEIIRLFYQNSLSRLPDEYKTLATEILLLLVLNQRTRNIYHKEALILELKEKYPENQIEKVLMHLDNNTRLIRSEIRSGGIYYEINSESLIPYIYHLKKEKEEKEVQEQSLLREKELAEKIQSEKVQKKQLQMQIDESVDTQLKVMKVKNWYRNIVIFILLIIACLGFWYYNKQKDETYKAQSQLYFNEAIRKTDPAFRYRIVKHAQEEFGSTNDSIKKLVDELEKSSANYYKTTSFYPLTLQYEIKDIFFGKNDIIGVIKDNGVDYYDHNGLLVKSINDYGEIIHADTRLGLVVCKVNDVYVLRKLNGEKVTILPLETGNGKIDAITPEGKSIIINGELIYMDSNGKKTQKLLPLSDSRYDYPSPTTFSPDGYIYRYYDNNFYKYSPKGQYVGEKSLDNAMYNVDAIYVPNDSNDLIYLDADGVKKIKLSDFKPKKQSLRQEKASFNREDFTEEYWNKADLFPPFTKLAFMPNTKNLITYGDATLPAIKNYDGKPLRKLNFEERINNLAVSDKGKKIALLNDRNEIIVFEKANILNLYKSDKLFHFSPLDYRLIGLYEFDMKKTYKKMNDNSDSLVAVLNYSNSLARIAYSNDGLGRKDQIKLSLKELSKYYNALVKSKWGKPLNAKILYNSYAKFISDSAYFSIDKSIDDSIYNAFDTDTEIKVLKWRGKAILVDKFNKNNRSDLMSIVRRYRIFSTELTSDDLLKKNYIKAITANSEGIKLLETIFKTEPKNKELMQQLAELYGNNSYYFLFTKNYIESIKSANAGIAYGKEYDWIYTNKALALLLNNQYSEALKIYAAYKNKMYTNGGKSFKEAFIEDFEVLEDDGIITPKNSKIYNDVKKIKTFLKSNK